MLRTYSRLKKILSEKYGQPADNNHYFSSPYYLGDGYEEQAVRNNKGSLSTKWPDAVDGSSLGMLVVKTVSVRVFYDTPKVVASGFSGGFEDADTPIYATVKDWQTENAAASGSLAKLVEEGWEIKQVVKTNGSAQTIQLLFIFEIDADKYPSTTFGKLKADPKKQGSSKDM